VRASPKWRDGFSISATYPALLTNPERFGAMQAQAAAPISLSGLLLLFGEKSFKTGS
jgi:hypothetical protein